MISKKIFSNLNIIVITAAVFIFNGHSIASEKTTEILLPTIQCGTCVKTIEKALNKIDGIINIDVDIENKKASITYDETKTDVSKIEDAISAAGYDANDKKGDKTAYDNLHNCCKMPNDR
ncbi:MAG TPA: cation transporter [Ignavibacteria bacterium]|jgi:copper ion binding protein